MKYIYNNKRFYSCPDSRQHNHSPKETEPKAAVNAGWAMLITGSTANAEAQSFSSGIGLRLRLQSREKRAFI